MYADYSSCVYFTFNWFICYEKEHQANSGQLAWRISPFFSPTTRITDSPLIIQVSYIWAKQGKSQQACFGKEISLVLELPAANSLQKWFKGRPADKTSTTVYMWGYSSVLNKALPFDYGFTTYPILWQAGTPLAIDGLRTCQRDAGCP